jgi:murein DD-endopeptidase MepM/ murein hydrolase activator NlpD
MDDRTLTFIVVPHGDLETRSFVISYRKLRTILICVVAFLLINAFVVALMFPTFVMAARVPGLLAELKTLETERAKVAELARALADVEAQYEKVRQLLGADAPAAGSPPMLPPLRPDSAATQKEPRPLSRRPEITQWPLAVRGFVTQTAGLGGRSHPGLDIAVASNSEVRAAGDGIVYVAGEHEVYGRYVVIDHGGGYVSVYGHANKLLVQQGDIVKAGQKIALTGSTGRSTAPHLHFEVRRDGQVVDPFRFVKQPK